MRYDKGHTFHVVFGQVNIPQIPGAIDHSELFLGFVTTKGHGTEEMLQTGWIGRRLYDEEEAKVCVSHAYSQTT
jgi:hypothetical protein